MFDMRRPQHSSPLYNYIMYIQYIHVFVRRPQYTPISYTRRPHCSPRGDLSAPNYFLYEETGLSSHYYAVYICEETLILLFLIQGDLSAPNYF